MAADSTYGQTTVNPYLNREGVTNVPQPGSTTTGSTTVSPTVTYTPGGTPREPGFYNPYNPYDTGRHGEQNAEANGGVGNKVSWWDYDRGQPRAGAVLNSEGYYGDGPGGGGSPGGGGGSFDPRSNPYYSQWKSAQQAYLTGVESNARSGIKQALIAFGLIPENFEDKLGSLDDTTRSLIKTNTDTGISQYARLLEGRSDAIRSVIQSLQNKGLRRSGAKGYLLRRRQLEYDRNFQDALGQLLGYIGGQYQGLSSAQMQSKQAEASFLAQLFNTYYNPYAGGGGSSPGGGSAAPSTTYYNSAAGASPYQPQADGYYTGGALYATPAENKDINSIFYFK